MVKPNIKTNAGGDSLWFCHIYELCSGELWIYKPYRLYAEAKDLAHVHYLDTAPFIQV